MAEYETEEQQVEAIKEWWKQNGVAVDWWRSVRNCSTSRLAWLELVSRKASNRSFGYFCSRTRGS